MPVDGDDDGHSAFDNNLIGRLDEDIAGVTGDAGGVEEPNDILLTADNVDCLPIGADGEVARGKDNERQDDRDGDGEQESESEACPSVA
jgi:hypothetical protein